MRRTYRSKKDTGGALDHRDVLLNMDEKSSAFDAFYIQNLKQTKRELTCVGSLDHAGTASNKVRKRKYVKRLVKEVKPVGQRQTLTTSVYLTPDKSIRVNKVLDPFDMLLNSSPAPQEPPKAETAETSVCKKKSKTCKRKRKPKIKKFNNSSTDGVESDKENTIDSNVTDIKAHELLIEKIPNTKRKHIDESINKIVSNLCLIDNLKRKSGNGLFNTSYKTRHRLTKNYQSPMIQKSPLCSTPFKEKYRGVSIFKFSPIMQKEQMSPSSEENNESNRSIILVSKSLIPKSSKNYKMSSLTHIPSVSSENKTIFSNNDNKDNSSIFVPEDKVQNGVQVIDNKKQSDNFVSNNEQSSCQTTEVEPFLGFSNNETENQTEKMVQSMLVCLENQSIQDLILDENDLVTNKSNEVSNIDTDENKTRNKKKLSSNIESNEDESVTEKSNDPSSNIDIDENKILAEKSDNDDSSPNIDIYQNEMKTKTSNPAILSSNIDTYENKLVTNYNDAVLSSNADTDENDSENSSNVGNDKPVSTSSNTDTYEIEIRTQRKDSAILSSNMDTDENESITNKNDLTDSSSNIDSNENDSENSLSNGIDKIESKTNRNHSSDSSLNVEIDENELESNNTCSGGSISTTNSSNFSNTYNTSESTVHSQSSDSKSLYDTCDSDQSSTGDDNPPKKEPIVALERLNESIFLKHYEKIIQTQDEVMSDQTDNEDYESLAKDSKEITINVSKSENLDTDEIKVDAIVITDSSTTDDVISTDECNNKEEGYEKDEKYVNFVTTRRRNEITNDSMFQFDQSYCSSNTECNKTVLSNKGNINKADNSTDTKNIPEDNLNEKVIDAKENCEAMKTDSVQDKLVPTKSRKSRLNNRNLKNPQLNDDFQSENSPNDRKSFINTRRGSRISRQSNTTSLTSPVFKPKPSKSSFDKIISKINTRKHSRLTKLSNSKGTEADNSENQITLTNSSKVDKNVVENDYLKNVSEDLEHRDSILPLPLEKNSWVVKESVVNHPERSSNAGTEAKPTIVLQPGKKWERSLSIYRRMTIVADHFDESILEDDCKQNKGRKYRQSVISTMEMQKCRDSLHNDSINSRRSTFVSNPGRPTIRFVKDPNFSRESLNTSSAFDGLKGFLSEECDDTVIELSKLSIADSELEVTVLDNFHVTERVTTARDYVLRRCNQTEPLLFDECYPETVLKNCHKIGEGVYGEVFLWRGRDGRARVMKVVPIAGSIKVNGEQQKDFHEIIAEIVIAMELSALRAPIVDIERQLDEGNDVNALELHAIENATDIFNEVLAVRCVHGPYPSRLIDLWELYDECKGSENDNPAALPSDQRYVVLELANAGQDLESYTFASAQQAYALFQQIAFGLAVAEEAFQFEHRDLHWGNVLIAPTEQKYATFVLRGRAYRVPRRGVAGTVIDYSLSRLSLPLAGDCAALYNDLAADEQLFDAVGDYQFEIYRLMRDKLGNDWKNFEPYTNILWLHYIVDKMITALRYKRTNTKIHKHYIEKLKGIKGSILEYGSAVQYVLTDIDF